MNRFLLPFSIVLILAACTAGFLLYLQKYQKFSDPGVKLVATPIHDQDGKLVGSHSVALPERVLNYSSEQQPVAFEVLRWLPKDTTYGQRLYKAPDGFQANINVVLMGADRTSIHDPKYCLTGQGWRIDQTDVVTIPMTKPHRYDLQAVRMVVSRQATAPDGETRVFRGVYVYWFVSDTQITADHGERMLRMAWEMVRTGGLVRPGKLQRWAYITFFSAGLPGQEQLLYDRLMELIVASVPEFQLVSKPASLAQSQ